MFDDILEFLKQGDNFSTQVEEVANKKKKVLDEVHVAIQAWTSKYLKEKNHSEDVIKRRHTMLLPSGSYSLGLMDCDADVDMVCLASNLVKREDFFETFEHTMKVNIKVKHYQALTLNRCPLVKMSVDGVKIDLSLAILDRPELPGNLELKGDDDDDVEVGLLSGMSENCARSLNGPRNMMAIMRIVPDVELFKNTLMVVRLWARRRFIYSCPIGYLGGASWAIMVAYVCSEHPCLNQLMALRTFFEVFSEWPWPKPLLLKELSVRKSGLNPWNSKDDYHHSMPIILPCYPEVNCAYNVNAFTKSTLIKEFRRGWCLLKETFDVESTVLLELLEPFDFFVQFRIYLVIIFRSHTCVEDHSCWLGLVGSRIRFLINDLCKISSVKFARILPNHFSYSDNANNYITKWYMGLEMASSRGSNNRLDITKEIEKFKSFVYTRSAEYGWTREGTELEVTNVIRSKGDVNGDLVKQFLPESDKGFHLIHDPCNIPSSRQLTSFDF